MDIQVNDSAIRNTSFFNKDKTRKKLEAIPSHVDGRMSLWGSLPFYLNDKQKFSNLLESDLGRLSEKYDFNIQRLKKDEYVALLLHWFKFNASIVDDIDDIIFNYPYIRGQERGLTYTISGLPGAGKTTLARTIANNWSDEFVVMESSDARYHLFAEKFVDLEPVSQSNPKIRKAMLEAPAYTVMTATILSICSSILNDLGYNVIHINNEFILNIEKLFADKTLFINHRYFSVDSISKCDFFKDKDQRAIKSLFRNGTLSLPEEMHELWRNLIGSQTHLFDQHDTYNWDRPSRITDFREMPPIKRSCRPAAIGLQIRKIYRQKNGIDKISSAKNWIILDNPKIERRQSLNDHLLNEFLGKTQPEHIAVPT